MKYEFDNGTIYLRGTWLKNDLDIRRYENCIRGSLDKKIIPDDVGCVISYGFVLDKSCGLNIYDFGEEVKACAVSAYSMNPTTSQIILDDFVKRTRGEETQVDDDISNHHINYEKRQISKFR